MNRLSNRSGFSLVELLTVIAIIAILAAVIFPVMTTVKERARQNQCITNLHQIGVAVQTFKTDNRKYPVILGSQVDDPSSPGLFENDKDVYLYPEYVKTIKMFHCPSSRVNNSSYIVNYDAQTSLANSNPVTGIAIYAYDSYDAFVVGPGNNGSYAISTHNASRRYDTNWAESPAAILASTYQPYPPNGSVANDDTLAAQDYARQLKFRNPPGDTVITWCSFHEGENSKGKSLVLFLDGSVDIFPATDVSKCMWRVRPIKS